jgi:endoglucanase
MVSCLKWAKCLSIGREGSRDRPAVCPTALGTIGVSIVWPCGRRTRLKIAALVPRQAIRLSLLVACALFIPPLAAFIPAQAAHAAQLHPASGSAGAPLLQVQGNQLVDLRSNPPQPIHLQGVNRSGTEYACIQGWGIFDGPSDIASILAIASWNANAVRVPLNEDCWLGINQVKPAYSGRNYQQAIATYVNILNVFGLVAILDLHWSAPGTQQTTGQQPMPDRDHSITFWRQVATAYANNESVVFDLFNEPYPDSNQDTPAAWRCWRYGGACSGVPFKAAGMQELVQAVRGRGARNVIMLGGVQYANALSQWLAYEPADTANNLVASWHVYDFNACNNVTCWYSTVAPVAQHVPIVTGEFGEKNQGVQFITNPLDVARSVATRR